MYCENCGKELDKGAKFCVHCGAKVETDKNTEITYMQGDAGNSLMNQGKNSLEEKQNRKIPKWGIEVLAVGVVLLALLIGLGIYNKPENCLARALNLGQKYLLEEDYEQAIVAFKKAIEIDPMSADAYLGMGDAYFGLGDEKENTVAALENYQIALELDGVNADIYIGIADAYIRLGENRKALEILSLGMENARDVQYISDKMIEIEDMADVSKKDAEKTNTDQRDSDNTNILVEEEELPSGDNVIYADTEEDLLNLLDSGISDKIIVLQGNKYKVSELVLKELENVTIWGCNGTRIVSSSGKEIVLNVGNCKGVILKNLVIGHDIPPNEGCDRGVLQIWGSDLTLVGCDIFGCGKEGFSAEDSTIKAENTIIRDCSDYIMELYNCEAIFQNCTFSGNGYSGMWIQKYAIPSYNSTFSFVGCTFKKNKNPGFIGYDTDAQEVSTITVEGCSFNNNGWD